MIKPEGYDTELAPVQFTLAELDMMYFGLLQHIGHPEAEDLDYTEEGFGDLLTALTKIQDYHERVFTEGEPTVVEGQ